MQSRYGNRDNIGVEAALFFKAVALQRDMVLACIVSLIQVLMTSRVGYNGQPVHTLDKHW